MPRQQPNRSLKKALFLVIFVLFFGSVLTAASLFVWQNRSNSTAVTESSLYIEDIRDLATLATAEVQTKTVVQTEDNQLFGLKLPFNVPGTRREVLFVIPATVLAGVDLQQLTDEQLVVDEVHKQITLTLPHATLLHEPSIHMEDVQMITDAGLFRDELNWEDGAQIVTNAQNQIKEEILESGVLQRAEDNTTTMLTNFLSKLGYSVTITYE